MKSRSSGGAARQSPIDILIVGGGPAGLSAALTLGRCLRRVLICDAGHPRNAAARVFNGFLSRDGSSPAEFLRICRQQLGRYKTVERKSATVRQVRRQADRFTATLSTGKRIASRMLILATGVVDELPTVKGFKQFYGKTVHSCPLCDGWEHRGEPLAVLGGSQDAADLALEMLLWHHDIVLCTDGPLECSSKSRHQLARHGIRIVETPLLRLKGVGPKLREIHFIDGTTIPRSVAYFYPAQFQKSPIAERLGCKFCGEEEDCLQCDESEATSVPGVYAVGNCSRGVQMVIAAAAEGARAAVAINNALVEADLARPKRRPSRMHK
jgi:thioredoxin reductase